MHHIPQIRAQLPAFHIDAMLLTGEANRFYAAGFHSSGTDGAALITEKSAFYFTDGRYTEAASHALGSAFTLRETKPGEGYPPLIDAVLKEEGITRLGFEDGSMTVKDYNRYREALPGCGFVPASDLMKQLREVKDPEELRALEDAQRIAENVLAQILTEIRPGVTEKELAARIQYLLLHFGASDKSFDPIVVSGPNGSLPHGVPSDREIRSGEFVTMDFGCIYRGYCSDMTRTVAVGSVTDGMRRIYETVLRAQEAGIAAAKPGVTGKAVDAAARAVIRDAGYGPYFTHSFGHGVGVEIHETPVAASVNDKPLPAGAVISAEPGIYLPGKLGVRIEDVIVITESGNRNLTQAAKELIVL